jgi:tetratricopeptide (TPR) repeat protein
MYEKALAANPNGVPVLLRLAQLNAGQLNRPDKAMGFARKARDLAPDNPEVARTLGRLALRSGEHAWALTLLEESSGKLPTDPELRLDLATCQFYVGQISNAVASAQRALALSKTFPRAGEAQRLTALAGVVLRPESAPAAAAVIQEALQDPAYVPALAAAASQETQRGNYPAARDRWEAVLRLAPACKPAFRQLALLCFEHLNDPRRAYECAMKSREADPTDVLIARVLGILAYGRNDYSRAAQLLSECSAAHPSDGELWYYLGMAHYQLKQRVVAKTELAKAIGLKLPTALSNECRKTLDSLK